MEHCTLTLLGRLGRAGGGARLGCRKPADLASEVPALADITNAPLASPSSASCKAKATEKELPRRREEQVLPCELLAKIISMAGPVDDELVVLMRGEHKEELRRLLAEQQALAPSPKRLAPHYVSSEFRSRFVKWIMTSWWLRTETVFLTCSLIDRFSEDTVVQGRLFGLVAITALAIATKFEEQSTLPIDDLLAAMDHAYTQQELANMETQMMTRLGNQVTAPTPATILPAFLQAMKRWRRSSLVGRIGPRVGEFVRVAAPAVARAEQDRAWEELAWWFAKLALFNVHTVSFMPSKVAASAVLLSNRIHGCRPEWPLAMAKLSGHTQSDLSDCVLLFERQWKQQRC